MLQYRILGTADIQHRSDDHLQHLLVRSPAGFFTAALSGRRRTSASCSAAAALRLLPCWHEHRQQRAVIAAGRPGPALDTRLSSRCS